MALSFNFAKFTSSIMEKQLAQVGERLISEEVIGSNPILLLFYFCHEKTKGGN